MAGRLKTCSRPGARGARGSGTARRSAPPPGASPGFSFGGEAGVPSEMACRLAGFRPLRRARPAPRAYRSAVDQLLSLVILNAVKDLGGGGEGAATRITLTRRFLGFPNRLALRQQHR